MNTQALPTATTVTPSVVAERVRKLLIDAASHAYEDARISGLCGEGAWEIAFDALRDADLTPATGNGP